MRTGNIKQRIDYVSIEKSNLSKADDYVLRVSG